MTLILALTKLHNYCIEVEDGPSHMKFIANDEWNSKLNDSVPLVLKTAQDFSEYKDVLSMQLLHGGKDGDGIAWWYDWSNNKQRPHNRNASVPLPRDQFRS
jgi:hypothetical protein